MIARIVLGLMATAVAVLGAIPTSGAEGEGAAARVHPGQPRARASVALNRSYFSTCAEEDNICVPLHAPNAKRFTVTATHPQYDVGEDNCAPDFTGCDLASGRLEDAGGEVCVPVFDNGVDVIEVCTVADWWRPYSMDVVIGDGRTPATYLRWYRKVDGAEEWPQFFVLYEDGNARLIPHPPEGRTSVCYGSSVIIGPAVPSTRPYADISEVTVDPEGGTIRISYREGGASLLTLSVDREKAVADVRIGYSTRLPFATLRSMWVADGNCDVERVASLLDDRPIAEGWSRLSGPSWTFYRAQRSRHNTSAPDITISLEHGR